MRRLRLLAPLAGVLALAAPTTAAADNLLTISQGEAAIRSEDAAVANAFVVEDRGADIRFHEPNDPKGIAFPAECRPGETRNGAVVEVFCPRTAITRSIAILTGPAEDTARYSVANLPGGLQGETGADRLSATAASNDILAGDQGDDALDAGPGDDDLDGADGNDDLKGGDGNDRLVGAAGLDAVDGGNGDDSLDGADGIAEKIVCGAGFDTAVVDQLDEVVDCEKVDRRDVAPPPDQPTAGDTTPPRLVAAAPTAQRVSPRRRSIRLVATSSEPGLVHATGYLQVAGVNERLKPARGAITVGGGGVELRLALDRRQVRRLRRALRRGRHPRVRITVTSVDAAGNTSAAKHLTVRLRH